MLITIIVASCFTRSSGQISKLFVEGASEHLRTVYDGPFELGDGCVRDEIE